MRGLAVLFESPRRTGPELVLRGGYLDPVPSKRKRYGAAVGKAPKKELLSFKQLIFDLLQHSLVGQLFPASRLDAVLFDVPRRTGTVLGTVTAKLSCPVVAVLDLRRVLKAPPKQSALSHAALIIPTPAVRTVSKDTGGGGDGSPISSPIW